MNKEAVIFTYWDDSLFFIYRIQKWLAATVSLYTIVCRKAADGKLSLLEKNGNL